MAAEQRKIKMIPAIRIILMVIINSFSVLFAG